LTRGRYSTSRASQRGVLFSQRDLGGETWSKRRVGGFNFNIRKRTQKKQKNRSIFMKRHAQESEEQLKKLTFEKVITRSISNYDSLTPKKRFLFTGPQGIKNLKKKRSSRKTQPGENREIFQSPIQRDPEARMTIQRVPNHHKRGVSR